MMKAEILIAETRLDILRDVVNSYREYQLDKMIMMSLAHQVLNLQEQLKAVK